ncbi:MAG: hypothetical protein RH860_13025 [Cytophagales bacterium]
MNLFTNSLHIAIIFSLLFACIKNPENETIKEEKPSYKIVYNVYAPDSINDDNYEIISMEMDGSDKMNITNFPGVEWTYMCCASKVYFISDKDTSHRTYLLYSMNADGSDKKQISSLILRDSWMSARKNCSEIIVSPKWSIDTAFYIINPKGEIIRKIKPDFPYFSDPAFSPDGSMIAFRAGKTASKKIPGFDEAIYTVDENGNKLKRLSTYPKSDTTAPWHAYRTGPPKWHPNGEFISFQSFQNGKYRLFSVPAQGGESKELITSDKSIGWHDWSPDGKYLALEMFDNEGTQFNIGLMDWETKELRLLTDNEYKYQQAPVFVMIN